MLTKSAPKGSIILKIVIVLLLALLVYTIWEPFDIVREEEINLRESRLRMSNIRSAQMFYFKHHDAYITDLDSLIYWIQTDSLVIAKSDSLFVPLAESPFVPESLRYSPKSHRVYRMVVDDTSATKRYLIEDPDGYGSIGSLTDVSLLHRATWEY
jgi:hypothetical protein